MKLIEHLKTISGENMEKCLKCSICTAFCPVYAADNDYPGPKQAGPDLERYRLKNPEYFDEVLKLCLNCKRCEVACPNGVEVGDIIQRARIQYSSHVPNLRDRILANTDFMGSAATTFAPIVNGAVRLGISKSLMDNILKIDRRRTFPSYAKQTFESWFRCEAEPRQADFSRQVNFFHGCYVNYNNPQLGKDFVSVMNALGYGVRLLNGEKCCGIALISNGLAEHASRNAVRNVNIMEKAEGPILTVSSTCTLTMRDEYPNLLGVDNSSVRDRISLAVRFISELSDSGSVRLAFRPDFHMKVAYHSACHAVRLGCTLFSINLMRMIPGLEVTVLEPQCCGIAGTYGFKKENYERSQRIGQALFDEIRAAAPDAVVTECETCKWQIGMSMKNIPIHNPITLLAEALDLPRTRELNR